MRWETFHQQEKLTTRINNILREYPPGIGPFKEFIQNADDAGAKEITIFLDCSQYPTEQLLCDQLSEWQGRALYVYNSAEFSDKDFEGITRVGQSIKHDDASTIGKYGLGFNCAYHFTDVISFISRDQLIMFDPHGEYLPEKVLGLRTNFLDDIHSGECKDQLETFQLPASVCGTETRMSQSFSGTLFRLPLRNKEQAAKSLLSKCYYSNKQMRSLLVDFAKLGPEMLLFLHSVETIKIRIRPEGSSSVQEIATISISNASDKLRASRKLRTSFLKDQVKFEKKDHHELSIRAEIEGAVTDEQWIVSAFVRSRELSAIEKEIDASATVQWVSIATRVDRVLRSGIVYCSLPLPITTTYPVHLNGNFALSSNRRHLWEDSEDEQSAPAAFKSKWNREICTMLASGYVELLTLLKPYFVERPEHLYAYWPCGSESSIFQQHLVPAFVTLLLSGKRHLFWSRLDSTWVSGDSHSMLPDPNLPADHPIYATLHQLRIHVLFLPEANRLMLKNTVNKVLDVLSPTWLVAKLRTNILQVRNSNIADELLDYLLVPIHAMNHSEQQRYIHSLDSLRLLPLLSGKVGILHEHASARLQHEIYLLCDNSRHRGILSDCEQFIDPEAKTFKRLNTKLLRGLTNVKAFSAATLSQFMDMVVPSTWKNVGMVYIGGNLVKENILNIGVSHMKHKKKNKSAIPKGLMCARDPSINVHTMQTRLDLVWEFLKDEAISNSLDEWPIVLVETAEGQKVCTIPQCRRIGAISKQEATAEHNSHLQLLKQFGCPIYDHGDTPSLAKLLGNTKKATFSTMIHYITHIEPKKLVGDTIIFRDIVLQWFRQYELDGVQIRSLPLFKNIKGTRCLTIDGGKKACLVPPIDWYSICATHFGDISVDIQCSENLLLMRKASVSYTDVKTFFADYLCEEMNKMPREVCIRFMESVANFRDLESVWIAKNNRLNQAILHCLSDANLIVFNDGFRCKISDVIDPSNHAMHALVSEMQVGDSQHLFPPAPYQTPAVFKIFNKVSSKSLFDSRMFLEFARNTVQSGNDKHGLYLVEFLSSNWKNISWPTQVFNEISELSFVPCWDMRESQLATVDAALKKPPSDLCAFADGCLNVDASTAWSQHPVLCPQVANIPDKFLARLNVQHPVKVMNFVAHITYLVRSFGATVPEEFRTEYKLILKALLQRLTTVVKKHANSTVLSMQQSLNIPFVMADNGELVYCHQLCFDLDADLGPMARAVPKYLQAYFKILSFLGTPVVDDAKKPVVVNNYIAPDAPHIFSIHKNNPIYSDLLFVYEADESKLFYAHRLVVCETCLTVKKIFEFNTAQNDQRVYTSRVPAWVNWDAFLWVMDYCYLGTLNHKKLSVKNQNHVALILDILQIADHYMMNHLKCWCEQQLSSVEVDVFNVCNLLLVAQQTAATQLEEVCLFMIRIMFTAVSNTDEYQSLSEETKKKIRTGSISSMNNSK